jgi:hypothetical protein
MLNTLSEVYKALENNRLSIAQYHDFQEDTDTNANLTIACATLAEAVSCLYATAGIPGVLMPGHTILNPAVKDYAQDPKRALKEQDGNRLDMLVGHHIDGYLRFFRQLVLRNNIQMVGLTIGLQQNSRIQLSACFQIVPGLTTNQYLIHYSLFGGTEEENARLFRETIPAIYRQFEKVACQ